MEQGALVDPAGKFRIYLGAAAGVGKTVAMLDEGHRRLQRGSDVVVGFVETHGRPNTKAKLEGLETLKRKTVHYRNSVFEEMDIDAVLDRAPQVVLIDELAHTNVPGSGRHEKRWEDVLEVLSNGVSVITTLNIQHLESIADAVEEFVGAKVRERVPDWVVRKADQIELVDSSPEQLRRRLLHGNVYPPDKIEGALSNFFRFENLAALRELALRFVADETEEEMLAYLAKYHNSKSFESTERIMVGVTGAPGTDRVLHRAARMAARARAPLMVVHVLQEDGKAEVTNFKKTCVDLGATLFEVSGDDVARALFDFAVEHRITQIVLGASQRSRVTELVKGSLLNKLLRLAGSADIDVHVIAQRNLLFAGKELEGPDES